MRKLILATLCIACIWAYPEKYNFDIKYDEIEIIDTSSLKEKILKVVPALLEGSCSWSLITDPTLVNDCVDETIATLDSYLSQEVEPLSMPDMHEGFSYHLIIHYHGELDLTKGEMKGLSTLKRTSNATLDMGLFQANFSLPLDFTHLEFNYDYSAKIMNLGPKGGLEGNIKNVKFNIGFGFDILKQELTLNVFDITSSGHIDFKFTGHVLVDWLFNLLSDAATSLLKKSILHLMEKNVKTALEGAVDEINTILHSKSSVALAAEANLVKTPYVNYKYVKPQL